MDAYDIEEQKNETIFLAQREVWQWPGHKENEVHDMPGLDYTIIIVKMPFLYDFCKNSIINKPQDELYDDGNWFINHYERTDASLWMADEAYQLHWSEGTITKYILCYKNRIVEILFGWEPTAEQMKCVGEKLGGN